MTTILKSSGSPTNTTRAASFGKTCTTIECEVTHPTIGDSVIAEDVTLVLNDSYFKSGRVIIPLSDAALEEYKHKKGKTMKQTPVVQTSIIIIPKDEAPRGSTITERWTLIVAEVTQACYKTGIVRTPHCWVTKLAIVNWPLFRDIIARHTLESKPHEFDEMVGKLWRSTRGLKTPRLGEDDEDDEEIKAVWKMASQNSRKLRNRTSYIKQSANYWNEHLGFTEVSVEQ